MKIHACRRCDGCGHIAGGYNWEIPWTRLVANDAVEASSLPRARACPDCGGTGALLEFASSSPRDAAFPTRRGMAQNHYRQHVAGLLRTQVVHGN